MCLAEHDVRAGSETARAAELIKMAIFAHKTVTQHLDNLSAGLEKAELNQRAKDLLIAIQAVEGSFRLLIDPALQR